MSMKAPYRSIMGVVVLTLLVAVSCAGPSEHAFYVALDGSDSNTGDSRGKPFATLARAQEAVRELTASGMVEYPVNVYIMGGTWELDAPLVFTSEDSGTPECPVTWRSMPDDRAAISGGQLISGWTVRDDGAWTTTVPGVADGWQFRQLWVNGERRVRARTPDMGEYLHVNGKLTTDDPAVLPFHDGDLDPAWVDKGDVELISLNKWTEYKLIIKSIDTGKRTATLSQKFHPWIIEEDARYWIENIPEACDAPGEWYLDFDTGVLVYRALPGENPESADVIAPRLTELVRFEGDTVAGNLVTDIGIRDIDILYTDWTMPRHTGYIDGQAANQVPGIIHADGADRIVIQDCKIAHHGNYGIDFFHGCHDNEILGCEITDIGAGGIRIGEQMDREEEREQTSRTLIADNHIHHIGEVFPEACGVIIFRSAENTISHNEIHDTYYTGISNGWSWGYAENNTHHTTIEYNHVYNIGRGMMSDMGGNYNLGVQEGTVVRNNLFHDISSSGYGGWGVYTDEGSTHILIENNVVYNTGTGGFHQHYGKENTVRNNIFAFSATKGQMIRSRGEEHLSFTFEKNIVMWDDAPLLGGNWGMTLSIYHTDDTLREASDTTSRYLMKDNVYWKVGGGEVDFMGLTLEEWQARGQDIGSIIADPKFTDPAGGDYSLAADSPALGIGFQPIDVSTVGPR
jgi:parallel beta-helix repeat protein